MTQREERKFTSLYFTQEERNGAKVPGKFNSLKVRFLYTAVEQIPMGRAHLYEYSKGKYSKVLCLKDGVAKKDLDKVHCPLCEVDRFGTPASKLFAFVQDINDGGKLKLLEFSWTLCKQIDVLTEEFGVPLHDIIFTLKKTGSGKDTTYTPIPMGQEKFSVANYLMDLGLDNLPSIVGTPADNPSPAMLSLTEEQIKDFINGKYPWSTQTGDDGAPKRKFASLTGGTITVHGTADTPISKKLEEEPEATFIPALDDGDDDVFEPVAESESSWF